MNKAKAFRLIILMLLLIALLSLAACQEVEEYEGPIYSIVDDEKNEANKDKTKKPQAIEKVTSSITNLKNRLKSQDVGEGGYYLGFDFHINTAKNANFVLKLQAHLFTWPYMNELGAIREDDLAKHNELIKKSTILLEWYDGINNSMLIGFYFDGVKANPNDPGNILYLNLQGEKRWFPDFGDSVLYQQMIRLITNFSIGDILASAGLGEDGGVSALQELFDVFVNNYKVVVNHKDATNKDETSILFSGMDLGMLTSQISTIIQNIFLPFQDKIDPLTKKYLGFKFSTLGKISLNSLNMDTQFFVEPDTDGREDILTSAYISTSGEARSNNEQVPFTADFRIYYGAAPPKPIQLDTQFYKFYDYGKYEFTGELYLPTMDLKLDALIRTKVNEYDNTINHVFSEFRDIANGDLVIGAYYKNELAYLDVEGLQHLYGGVKIEDIGFPKVYVEGWDLADMLKKFFNMVDNTIINMVDRLLDPLGSQENDMIQAIMNKMASTEKDPKDPLSKNTVMIRVDHELLKDVLRESGQGDKSTRDIINIINAQLPITLDEIATILGITSAEILLEKTWLKFTLDVDTNQITIQVYSDIGIIDYSEPSKLLMQLDLIPVKIGEDMVIAEIKFDDFNELLPVYTYSAEMGGQFLFSNAELVDLSELLSSFMDDYSGLNTPYILPKETKLDFTLAYDQYIKAQYLQKYPGGEHNGRWTEASRNAFILNVFIKGSTPNDNVTLFNIYANDVSFKSNAPVEELGYIWIDFVCLRNNPNVQEIPKFKIREDYWLQSVNRYLNKTEAGDNVGGMLNPDISLSITTIISALVEDSFVVFQPDQIEITTSNETVQNIFGVDSLIGNIHAQIGLVQRVFGVDEIEDEFAVYTVGELEKIEAQNFYTTKLHDSIEVTFTFNQNGRTWDRVVPLKFLYDMEKINLTPSIREYYLEILGPIRETETSPIINRFMGEQRGHEVKVNNSDVITRLKNEDWYDPYDKRIITKAEVDELKETEEGNEYFNSIMRRLLPYYRFEPMLSKPEEMTFYVDSVSSTEGDYSVNILIDWQKITTAGGEFFTDIIVGEGMLGELSFPVYIIITNRVIDTSNQNPETVYVSADPSNNALIEAPVIDTITIDPYEYLWQEAIYFRNHIAIVPDDSDDSLELIAQMRKEKSLEFIKYYFATFNIRINFVDFDPDVIDFRDTPVCDPRTLPEEDKLLWYFDRYQLEEYYKETDIVLTGGTTYIHANFLGQIIALQVNIASRTIRALNFGEEEDDVYTADMLNRDTFSIPLYPLIIFQEKDQADRYITRRLVDDKIAVPMIWSHKEVDNPNIHGTDTPFKASTNNRTSSFVDLYGALGVGEWIFKDYAPIRVIRVECPPKEIAELDVEPVMGYESLYNWDNNIETEFMPSNILVGQYDNPYDYDPAGFYYVDPFNLSTARIPEDVMVTFKGRLEGDPTYTRGYTVAWQTDTGLIEYNSEYGYYSLTVNSENEKYIRLTALVGEADIGQIEITLAVKILTSNFSDVTFYDDEGNIMEMDKEDADSYRYIVDTFEGFKLPVSFRALFGESDIREYLTYWKGFDGTNYTLGIEDMQFKAGNTFYLRTTLPGANESLLSVDLELITVAAELEDIIFTNIPMIMVQDFQGQWIRVPLPVTLNINPNDTTIDSFTIDGVTLNREGKIDNLYFGRGFYENSKYELSGVNVPFIEGLKNEWGEYIQLPVEPVSLYPYELLDILFQNTCLILKYLEIGEQNQQVEVTRHLLKNYSIHNLKGIMNINDILQRVGDSGSFNFGGEKYIVRMGQGQGAYDLLIRSRFTGGLYVQDAGEQTQNIEIYDQSGNAIFGEEGYIFGNNIEADLTVLVQADGTLSTFRYGTRQGSLEKLNLWHVEMSNVESIPVGSYITSLPRSLLYGPSNSTIELRISYLTKEGFRIIKDINIVEVKFGGMYNSVPSYNDMFEIENGRITITDLYKFYPLNLYLSSTDFLPKTITRSTDEYTVTITDVKWTIMSNWRTFLQTYDYTGDSVDIILAKADILGWYEVVVRNGITERVHRDADTITLYIRVESAEAIEIPLEESHGLDTDYEDITVTSAPGNEIKAARIYDLFGATTINGAFSYREFIINMDAYHNSNYQGIFIPPANLVIKYHSGVTHAFSALRYVYRGVDISEIRYGINGIEFQNDSGGDYIIVGSQKVYLMRGDNRYNITLSVDLGAGQVIAIRVHFYDKTVVGVKPVVNYDDQEVREQITSELADIMEELMYAAQNRINITKLEHEITGAINKNIQLREFIDLVRICDDIRRLDMSNVLEQLFIMLNAPPEIIPNPNLSEDISNHNYVTTILIGLYENKLEDGVNDVYDIFSQYLSQAPGVTFENVEDVVNDYFYNIYNESARLIINNKILDFVEPAIMSMVQSMGEEKNYVVKLKNQIESKLNIMNVLREINDINSADRANAIYNIINSEFDRMISQTIAASTDSDSLKDAVVNILYIRRNEYNSFLLTKCEEWANEENIRIAIEEYFELIFNFVEDDYNSTILAVVQEIENTSRNLILEMRASMAAGLFVNTGGRLTRAVNLSIASAVNNVVLEGKIVDAIIRARNLNAYYTDDGIYTIDPYADYIYVPTRAEIMFSETNGGNSYTVNINWSKPLHWSTPSNPNAGITYRGNESDIRDTKSAMWETLFNETLPQMSTEQYVVHKTMEDVLKELYVEKLGIGMSNPSDAQLTAGWITLDINPSEKSAIESRVLVRNPQVSEDELKRLSFAMWSRIESWDRLKLRNVSNDPYTTENEHEIWEDIRLGLSRRELAIMRDEFTATLYSDGIESQDLSLIIIVQERRLIDNTWNLYNEKDGVDCSKNDPIYHIEDPFAGRVTDFPDQIKLDNGIITDADLISFSDLNVKWEYTDQAITYAGKVVYNENTGKYGIIITGYIKNKRVGQSVTIRLIINAWEYNDTSGSGIRQYTGTDGDIYNENNYTIMNPISFVSSKLVNYSAQDLYQVMIKETKYMSDIVNGELVEWTDIVYRNVLFYPEDSRLVQNSINDEEMEQINQKRNYLIYWDNEAKNLAYNTGVTVKGSFSLGNEHKNKYTIPDSAYYQYEESYINKVNATNYSLDSLMGWYIQSGQATNEEQALIMAQAQVEALYGTTGVSLIVLNPLMPELPDTVQAMGILNQIPNTSLGQVRALWNKTYAKAVSDMKEFVLYMYPTLTSSEAERSAREMLLDTTRSQYQEKELINDMVAFLKNKWQVENLDEFSTMDNENWDIYYYKDTTTPALKKRMDNMLDTIILNNGDRKSETLKYEGWYRMYTFLNIQNRTAPTIQAKASSWYELRQDFLSKPTLYNEIILIEDQIPHNETNDEFYAMCWDAMASKFEGEDIIKLNLLINQVEQEYPELEHPNNTDDMFRKFALAWDKWIKMAAFRSWMIRLAKDMLMIDEYYDIQTSAHYLDGGIDGTKTVTLLLQLTEGGFIYTQTFKVRLAFLDLAPLAYYQDVGANNRITTINPNDLPTELTIAVKTDYANDDYLGRINPYDTTQEIVFNMLDFYAYQSFNAEVTTKIINNTNVAVKLIRVTNIVWNIPLGAVSGSRVYSTSFTIGNKTYQSNLLRMILT